jgi:DNA-binding LacI/PurR family transcriptional regulator
MPGVATLTKELGVNHKTVEAALRLLEQDGILVGQGPRRPRRIQLGAQQEAVRPLRVEILLCENEDQRVPYILDLHHQLQESGHSVHFASKTLHGLGRNVSRLGRFVGQIEADAWVVSAGSRDELGWFAENKVPVFALAGRARRLPVASIAPDKVPAMQGAVGKLVQQGHRRIVLLVRPERRIPEPGFFERAFLDELASHGITAGNYHLPDWDESPEGFHAGLEKLFRMTPPTALLVDEPIFISATLQFCLKHGIRVPEDLSLVCTDPDPSFAWCRPSVAHIHWDSDPWIRRILRWAVNVSRGKEDRRQSLSKAKFVDGGTIGPAPGRAGRD